MSNLHKLSLRTPVQVRAAARKPLSAAGALVNRKPRTICRALEQDVEQVDLEVEVEAFMKRQAELESGAAFARVKDPEAIIGAETVPEDSAKEYCADIFEILRMLKDMSVNEVRLVVSIEDPRTRERRSTMDIESDSGVSRDEMATALMDVADGRIPKDRIALKCLHGEINNWPFLAAVKAEEAVMDHEEINGWPFLEAVKAEEAVMDAEAFAKSGIATPKREKAEPSSYAAILDVEGGDTIVMPYTMGQDARRGDKPQSIMDMLPDWVGFGALYGISALPALFVIGTVAAPPDVRSRPQTLHTSATATFISWMEDSPSSLLAKLSGDEIELDKSLLIAATLAYLATI
eukprot:gene4453-14605_t